MATGSEQNLWSQLKPRESDISPMCWDAPTGAIALNFGLPGDVADVITHAKFYVNRFTGFGLLTPTILSFSIGLADRPYNSVSTTVLHCDKRHSHLNAGVWMDLSMHQPVVSATSLDCNIDRDEFNIFH